MIIFGPPELASYNNSNNYVIFNLSSIIEIGMRLYLIPNTDIGRLILSDETLFDTMYFQFLMNEGFIDFMRIILYDYFGTDVYVCIEPEGNNDIKDAIALSIIKFAQLRYGIIINTVSDKEDFDYCKETDYTAFGIQNFQQDKERFVYQTGGDEFARFESAY